MKWNSFLIVFIFVQVYVPASAQLTELCTALFSPDNALDNQRVSCILQDSRGLLWLGTNSGLYMYDGHRMRHFQYHAADSNSLLNNNITAILEDAGGDLWIGTESGISRWKHDTGGFKTLLVNQRIRDLHLSSDNLVFAALGKEGLIYFDPSRTHPGPLPVRSLHGEPVIESLEESRPGVFYLATDRGLLYLNLRKGILRPTGITDPLNSLALSENGSYLCAGTAGGEVILFEPGKKTGLVKRYRLLERNSRNYIRTVRFDGQSTIWAGTTAGLFFKTAAGAGKPADRRPDAFTRFSRPEGGLVSDDIHSIYVDDFENIWVGSLSGLNWIKRKTMLIRSIPVKPNGYIPLNQQVRSVHYDRFGYLWIGTDDDGAFRFNRQMSLLEKIPVPGSKISGFLESSSGTMFIAANNRLWELDYRGQKTIKESDFSLRYEGNTAVTAIAEPIPGEIWFGTWKEGLRQLKDGRVSQSALTGRLNANWEHLHIADLMKDSSGDLWVATRGQGLIRIELMKDRFDVFDFGVAEGEVTYGILCLTEDRYGNVWAGTRGGGVFVFEGGRPGYRNFTVRDGLPFSVVCAIAEDKKGHIWLSTEKGMARYIPNRSLPFVYFDKIDRLTNKRFKFDASAVSPGGELFFGSINGLFSITPGKTPEKQAVPRAVLRSITVNGRAAGRADTMLAVAGSPAIKLGDEQNDIELNFASTDYASLNTVTYAYRLKGFEEEFSIAMPGQRAAVYKDLPPGDYIFELISADGNGRWIPVPSRYELHLATPFWRRLPVVAASVIAGLALIIICVALIKRRKHLGHQFKNSAPNLMREISLEPVFKNPDSADDELVRKITFLLEERISDPMFTMGELIAEAGMSRATFYRKVKELFNDTPSNLIRTYRLKRAAQLLELQKFQVAEIAYMTGFRDPKYFSQCFYRKYRCIPSEYCRGRILEVRTG